MEKGCPDSASAWSRFYLDDGILCGKITTVEGMFKKIREHSPSIRLLVNEAKCKAWGPGLKPSPESVIPITPWESGVKILGVPVGHNSYVNAEVSSTLSRL
jgi:hypothetical protein